MIMYWSVMDGKEGTTPRSDGWPMTSRSDGLMMTSRSDRGKMEPERSSVNYINMVQDLNQQSPVMVDSYLSRLDSVTRSDDEGTWETSRVQTFDSSVLETDRKCQESVRSAKRKWPSYLTPPNGLRIITWDEFIDIPDMLSGHFVLEKNGYITHDASQVNVFFHDARMMQTNLGSLSQSGKSWTIFVQDYQELKSICTWLTERISVLAVTLRNKNHLPHNNLGSTVDPSFTSIQDKIQTALSQAMESFLRQRQFCVILDFNSSVERWCEEVLHMRCDARGAKIVITNGDEPPDLSRNDENMCCHFLCLPFRLIQGTAYKVQRRSTYDDYDVAFDEEHIILCTANTKLQAYAEKAQNKTSAPSRRVNKKKSTVTFTEGTQTAEDGKGDVKTGNGDCGVIDLEDMERGGEAENPESSRETAIYGRVIKDKDRASLVTQDSAKSRVRAPVQKKHTQERESEKTPKTVKETVNLQTSIPEEAGVWSERSVDIGERSVDVRERSVDVEDESRHEEPGHRQTPNTAVIDVQADVHCASYRLQQPEISEPPKVSYSRVNSEAIAVQKIIQQSDEVRHSVQTLKLDNYVPDPQFSIDVFDTKPNQVVTNQPDSVQNKSNPKQQKRIDKMLKDIMGPASNRTKTPTRRGKYKNGIVNSGFQGDQDNINGDISPDSPVPQDRPRTSDASIFSRKDAYSTLPLTKVNGGRSASKSADFDEVANIERMYDTPISPKKVKKIKQKFMEKEEEKLFTPRFMLDKDRNCFSDLDPVDDFTDVDANAAASDNEGRVTSRIISVKNTEKTVSVDSVTGFIDTELELTDCDTEDMSVASEDKSARKRANKSNKRLDRSQKGQYDSRRKYLALNSLRRKTKARMLNAEIRNRARAAKT